MSHHNNPETEKHEELYSRLNIISNLNYFYLKARKSPSLPGVKSQPKRCDAARGSARWLAPYLQDAKLILKGEGRPLTVML